MNSNEMNEILEKHEIWIFSRGKNGEKPDLRNAKLGDAELREANLRGVDLNNADLQDINLTSTDLPESTFIIFGKKYFISICGDYVRVGC